LLDITVMAENDPDFQNVPQIVRQSTEFNNQTVAVPHSQRMLGYFVNKDLFNQANIDYTTMDSSVEEFAQAIRDITNISEGKIGKQDSGSISNSYPAAVKQVLGCYT